MPVRSDAAEEEPDPAHRTNPVLVFRRPRVDPSQDVLPRSLDCASWMAVAEREVNRVVSPHVLERHSFGQTDSVTADQRRPLRLYAEAFQVEVVDVEIEAVGVSGIDWIELVDLDEAKRFHDRFDGGIYPPALQLQASRCALPRGEEAPDFVNEVFRSLPGRQGHDTTLVVLDPLEEADRRQGTERWEIIDDNDTDPFVLVQREALPGALQIGSLNV